MEHFVSFLNINKNLNRLNQIINSLIR